MKKIIRSAVVGGIVLFAWSSFSWMALSWHAAAFKKSKNEWVMMMWTKTLSNGSGIYLVPSPTERGKPPATTPSPLDGKNSFAFIVFNEDGYGSMNRKMALAFVFDVLAAAAAAALLSLTSLKGVARRGCFVMALGLTAALAAVIPQWIWWGFSPEFTAIAVLDLAIGWFLAGLAMAKLARA